MTLPHSRQRRTAVVLGTHAVTAVQSSLSRSRCWLYETLALALNQGTDIGIRNGADVAPHPAATVHRRSGPLLFGGSSRCCCWSWPSRTPPFRGPLRPASSAHADRVGGDGRRCSGSWSASSRAALKHCPCCPSSDDGDGLAGGVHGVVRLSGLVRGARFQGPARYRPDTGGANAVRQEKAPRRVAVVLGALIFSAFHYIGPTAITQRSFVFRTAPASRSAVGT